jgi:hypothetical protein
MINNTFGAPLGGTTSSGQYGFESTALGLIWPRNGFGGFGRYRPSMVVVAPGEPGVPVMSAAGTGPAASRSRKLMMKVDVRNCHRAGTTRCFPSMRFSFSDASAEGSKRTLLQDR